MNKQLNRFDITLLECEVAYTLPVGDVPDEEYEKWWREEGQHQNYIRGRAVRYSAGGREQKNFESPRFRRDNNGDRESALRCLHDLLYHIIRKTLEP